jgi:hypothetical protein
MQSEAPRHIACTCDDHRNVYADLPWTDVELEIASCMRTCPYCGEQFKSAGNLRLHLKGAQYRHRNIIVKAEKAGHRGVRSPKWSRHNLFSATSEDRSVCDLLACIQDVPGFDKYLPSGAEETNFSTLEDISSETRLLWTSQVRKVTASRCWRSRCPSTEEVFSASFHLPKKG